jgi:prepilin-type N-terminal cleavage/methylation domain-containing protein
MKRKTKLGGFTLIELLVVMSIIALLLSILMPALGRARAEAMLTKDQTQVKSIFSGFSFWTPSHNGNYPIPGLEARRAGSTGDLIKGRGPEDLTQNDHARMLSMCVMQNLFSTDVLYAPTEQGDFVAPMENYDYNFYDPAPQGGGWELWDPTFGNDLTDEIVSGDDYSECNNSYGIMPVTGKRKQQNWGSQSSSTFPIVGTRGPEDGEPNEFSRSNLFHGIERDWKGTITFGDGHNEVLETFFPVSTTYVDDGGEAVMDNIFLEEEDQAVDNDYMPNGLDLGQGADAILTHVIETAGDPSGSDGKGGKCDAFYHD